MIAALDIEILTADLLRPAEPILSPNGGTWAFTLPVGGVQHIFTMPANGGLPRQMTAGFKGFAHPNWSHDGKRLCADSRGGVWIVDADGKNLRRISAHPAGDSWGSWSPDGKRIFFGSRRNGWTQIWTASLDDPDKSYDKQICLTPQPQDFRGARISPDGRRLAVFLNNRPDHRRSEIWIYPTDGSGQGVCITPDGDYFETHPTWTRDGKHLLFLSESPIDDRTRLYRAEAAHPQQRTPMTNGKLEDNPVVLSHDGARFAFTRYFAGATQLWLGDTQTSSCRQHDLPTATLDPLAFSADASSLYVMRQTWREIPHLARIDLQSKHVEPLTDISPPGYAPEDFAVAERFSFRGREGAMIEGCLWTPPAVRSGQAKNAPLIIIAHGGPAGWTRSVWNPEWQWLISQGYGLLQFDFRGSSTYGRAFRRALYNRWADADMIDLNDTLQWAYANVPWIDRNRLAIKGASYGGYMVFLALVRMPGVFRCGLAMCGISEMADFCRQCNRSERLNTIVQMGDPELRPEAYRRSSPLYELENITAPLIVSHGRADVTVPVNQAEMLVQEMKNQGKTCESKFYEGEGHSLSRAENKLDLIQRETAFLKKYL